MVSAVVRVAESALQNSALQTHVIWRRFIGREIRMLDAPSASGVRLLGPEESGLEVCQDQSQKKVERGDLPLISTELGRMKTSPMGLW